MPYIQQQQQQQPFTWVRFVTSGQLHQFINLIISRISKRFRALFGMFSFSATALLYVFAKSYHMALWRKEIGSVAERNIVGFNFREIFLLVQIF
jgi:hypothetical protein